MLASSASTDKRLDASQPWTRSGWRSELWGDMHPPSQSTEVWGSPICLLHPERSIPVDMSTPGTAPHRQIPSSEVRSSSRGTTTDVTHTRIRASPVHVRVTMAKIQAKTGDPCGWPVSSESENATPSRFYLEIQAWWGAGYRDRCRNSTSSTTGGQTGQQISLHIKRLYTETDSRRHQGQ